MWTTEHSRAFRVDGAGPGPGACEPRAIMIRAGSFFRPARCPVSSVRGRGRSLEIAVDRALAAAVEECASSSRLSPTSIAAAGRSPTSGSWNRRPPRSRPSVRPSPSSGSPWTDLGVGPIAEIVAELDGIWLGRGRPPTRSPRCRDARARARSGSPRRRARWSPTSPALAATWCAGARSAPSPPVRSRRRA